MVYVIAFGMGMVAGIIIFSVITFSKRMGNLRIDMSDPDDKPYLFLELKGDIRKLCHKKQIILRIKKENYIPHK